MALKGMEPAPNPQ